MHTENPSCQGEWLHAGGAAGGAGHSGPAGRARGAARYEVLGSARSDTARIQIERLSGILDIYRLEVGHYPTDQEGLQALVDKPAQADAWNGPYIKNRESLTDPWGAPYAYRSPGQHGEFDLYTLGADGKEGGEGADKDVTNW